MLKDAEAAYVPLNSSSSNRYRYRYTYACRYR